MYRTGAKIVAYIDLLWTSLVLVVSIVSIIAALVITIIVAADPDLSAFLYDLMYAEFNHDATDSRKILRMKVYRILAAIGFTAVSITVMCIATQFYAAVQLLRATDNERGVAEAIKMTAMWQVITFIMFDLSFILNLLVFIHWAFSFVNLLIGLRLAFLGVVYKYRLELESNSHDITAC